MTRRMIDAGVWANENFANLPAMARLLQIGIITLADDQGRAKGNPAYLRSQVFPYDDVSLAEIDGWLDQMARNETLIIYTVNGKTYLQLLNWWDYQSLQYAMPSTYPAPSGWKDRIRKTITKGFIATYNWTLTNGAIAPDTCDTHGRPLPEESPEPTPVTPVKRNASSPDDSGDDSGERSPEGTNKLNRTEKKQQQQPRANDAVEKSSSLSFSQICDLVKDKFRKPQLSQSEQTTIDSWTTTYPSDWIPDAIQVAIDAGHAELRYTTGVLRNWKKEGRTNAPSPNGAGPPAKSTEPSVIHVPF